MHSSVHYMSQLTVSQSSTTYQYITDGRLAMPICGKIVNYWPIDCYTVQKPISVQHSAKYVKFFSRISVDVVFNFWLWKSIDAISLSPGDEKR